MLVWCNGVAISYVIAKIKSRHFCKSSKCRLFCHPKMCYNVIMKEVLVYLRRWGFELYYRGRSMKQEKAYKIKLIKILEIQRRR